MSDPMTYQPPSSGSSNVKTAVLVGAVVALLAANVYLYLQVDSVKTEMAKLRESIQTEFSNVKESTTVTSASNRRNIETLKTELEEARRQANAAAGRAKTEALTHAELLARKLEAEQKRQSQIVTGQISEVKTEVKEAASNADAKIAGVSGDVTNVKTEVASNKSELEKTIADLKKVNGDLGVQSGYIATNGKELAMLKRLGERNYFEFNLAKTKTPQKIGDITVLLKKTDQKKNKYTVEVYADDKRTEKKDKNVNEPVQFYVAKAKQPYEFVVNEIKKDVIVGYLATPKDVVARN